MTKKKRTRVKRPTGKAKRVDQAALTAKFFMKWSEQMNKSLTKIETFAVMPSLNGTKWKEGTGRHYKRRLLALLAQAPPKAEAIAKEFKKRIDALPW